MSAMLRVTRAELRRFCTASYALAAIALPAFFSILTTALTFSSASGNTTNGAPPGARAISVADLSESTGYFEGVAQAFTFLGVIAVVLAAMSIATDYSQGTLRNLLVRQPSRWRLLGGKLLALAVLVSISAAVAALAGTATAHLAASGAGVSTSAWALGSLLPRIAGLAAGLVGWAAIGALLATVLRSVPAAIGIAIGWALPVETIVGATWTTGKSWFPGGVFEAIAMAGSESLSLNRALVVGAAYLAIAVVAGLTIFTRREVTA
jgi:ABC-2 type transport system permease protein